VLIDHYEEDWSGLWWIRVDGRARTVDEAAESERAIEQLVARYEQYRRLRPAGPVVAIVVDEISGWSGA
jgi:hypothetical protein